MAGRGRGGRGGGRGGGAQRGVPRDQLSWLGLERSDMPAPLQPPPTFPLTDRKPLPLTNAMEMDYLLILRQDFIDRMQISSNYIKMPTDNKDRIEKGDQGINKLIAQLPPDREKYDWSIYPQELRPKGKRKLEQEAGSMDANIVDRLIKLERLETEIEKKQSIKTEVEDEENEDEDVREDFAEIDEEMDDSTDYANNYFDNGEGYDDDDDNMEDGPIY